MRPLGTRTKGDGPCACCDRNGRHICQRALKKRARRLTREERQMVDSAFWASVRVVA